jgi:formylglycine-generating enzyme required for sulfatase activity
MAGTVWEWCQDWLLPYPGKEERVDPHIKEKPAEHPGHVVRGGSWYSEAAELAATTRKPMGHSGYYIDNTVGFRLVFQGRKPGTSSSSRSPVRSNTAKL